MYIYMYSFSRQRKYLQLQVLLLHVNMELSSEIPQIMWIKPSFIYFG